MPEKNTCQPHGHHAKQSVGVEPRTKVHVEKAITSHRDCTCGKGETCRSSRDKATSGKSKMTYNVRIVIPTTSTSSWATVAYLPTQTPITGLLRQGMPQFLLTN